MTEAPKICVAGADLSHADRQADRQTDMKKLKLLFFTKAPKITCACWDSNSSP